MTIKSILQFGSALVVLAAPVAAQDASGQMGLNDIMVLRGWQTENGTYMAAVLFSLEDGWKTYWRAPSQSGIPPQFSWDGSENLSSVKFHWPAPKVYTENGITTIGYKGDFILPIELMPVTAGKPIKVKSQVEYGLCSDVCIPARSTLDAVIEDGPVSEQILIKTALAARPHSAVESDLHSISCLISPNKNGMIINANITFRDVIPDIDLTVIEYIAPNTWIDQLDLKRSEKTLMAQAELVSFTKTPVILDPEKLRITLIGDVNAIEINGCSIKG